jgi:hypothetical protein
MTTQKKRTCSSPNCTEPHYGRGFCSKHYYQHSKAGSLEDEIVRIPQPPPPPPNKKRCHAIMTSGERCLRWIRAKSMCSAHWKEWCDQQDMELRERPLNSTVHEYEGNEAALIAALEKRS